MPDIGGLNLFDAELRRALTLSLLCDSGDILLLFGVVAIHWGGSITLFVCFSGEQVSTKISKGRGICPRRAATVPFRVLGDGFNSIQELFCLY